MAYIKQLVVVLVLLGLCSCRNGEKQTSKKASPQTKKLHIVFVTGDEEYRSEESMPMLARLAKRALDAKVTLCYSLDTTGLINPNRTDYIAGLEALATADLMVLFTRFRNLPKQERDFIVDYAESGKPMVGFRTATHAFYYKDDPALSFWNNEWPAAVFGQQWITHHGHFDDGDAPLTQVTHIDAKKNHAILQGVEAFDAYSWLYHVDGGDWKLQGDSNPILLGRSLRSKHEMNGRLNEFPMVNPVAWTKSYTGKSNLKARVFFTTLGHPFDFKLPAMRKLSMNGIFWALGKENEIPPDGINVTLNHPYEPNNSGFGEQFKKNQRPLDIR